MSLHSGMINPLSLEEAETREMDQVRVSANNEALRNDDLLLSSSNTEHVNVRVKVCWDKVCYRAR